MADMFGTKWINAYGADPDPRRVWEMALSNVSDSQIESGLNLLADSGAKFVPTIPEFKALCVQPTLKQEIKKIIQEEKARTLALPKPASKQVAKKYISEIIKQAREKS